MSDILNRLDEELDRRNNPTLILLGHEEYRDLDRTLSELGQHGGVRRSYDGVTIVRVPGRTKILKAIEGDPQVAVRADVSDFTNLLRFPPVVTDRLQREIRQKLTNSRTRA